MRVDSPTHCSPLSLSVNIFRSITSRSSFGRWWPRIQCKKAAAHAVGYYFSITQALGPPRLAANRNYVVEEWMLSSLVREVSLHPGCFALLTRVCVQAKTACTRTDKKKDTIRCDTDRIRARTMLIVLFVKARPRRQTGHTNTQYTNMKTHVMHTSCLCLAKSWWL